ncbi:MAG: TIGR00153 family protein [Deltaproteobacteria bacterium]|nr:TIGR00153 family protein [Deltaproteobacteria bacterium]MBW2400871.1 TIGR00153 family protein [Deltaproteobacteria bacterium]
MSLIGNLFGASPIRPMQRHMQAAVACAREVLPLFEDMVAGRTETYPDRRKRVDELEHQADDIKHEIRSKLPNRLFMAFERRDILEILDQQDSIADRAQDIAELVDQRKMVVPELLAEAMLDLVRKVIATCEHAGQVIQELDELVETGFSGREVERVRGLITVLNGLETETDELAERVKRKLFEIEDSLGVSTVFWYELIGWVARMADHAEKVGNRMRVLIAN